MTATAERLVQFLPAQERDLSDLRGGTDAGRAAPRILFDGEGEIAVQLAGLLRREIAGDVLIGRGAADALDLELRSGELAGAPSLVVMVAPVAASSMRAGLWRNAGVPHLPVVYDTGRVMVGPVVVPGAPCLRCLDLHRCDKDPSWPLFLARLDRGLPPPAVEPTACALGAGLAALMIRNLWQEERHLPGVSLEVALPEPTVIQRRWSFHARCDCVQD
ncbi:hypothetical protein SAMN05421595_0811 [Austwickia chelonae]|uniref:THIF-type NAD/FAD binding fold domain-containing protein n=1 Tax=Austwickia chelonae NBRC 105200 TaxID=1184607 RepID=K6VNI2_9MICO|nr:hypothetical protein [Austwickia chelonae]GAB78294.1 hypothetical protein AUCHE_08_05400 [Austwickia chelonae NBRC 105200]SEW00654.1 hypothetical protein SAMN05421595_0811 [Austwickia chelonae]